MKIRKISFPFKFGFTLTAVGTYFIVKPCFYLSIQPKSKFVVKKCLCYPTPDGYCELGSNSLMGQKGIGNWPTRDGMKRNVLAEIMPFYFLSPWLCAMPLGAHFSLSPYCKIKKMLLCWRLNEFSTLSFTFDISIITKAYSN